MISSCPVAREPGRAEALDQEALQPAVAAERDAQPVVRDAEDHRAREAAVRGVPRTAHRLGTGKNFETMLALQDMGMPLIRMNSTFKHCSTSVQHHTQNTLNPAQVGCGAGAGIYSARFTALRKCALFTLPSPTDT